MPKSHANGNFNRIERMNIKLVLLENIIALTFYEKPKNLMFGIIAFPSLIGCICRALYLWIGCPVGFVQYVANGSR